jgi:hypothetical protein
MPPGMWTRNFPQTVLTIELVIVTPAFAGVTEKRHVNFRRKPKTQADAKIFQRSLTF